MKAIELVKYKNITLNKLGEKAVAEGVHQGVTFTFKRNGELLWLGSDYWPSVNNRPVVDFTKLGRIQKLKFGGKIQSRRRFKKLIKELINASK